MTFSAREVVAFREPFRSWGREFHDPGVALDELMSLEPREPAVLRVTRGAGRRRGGPWADVVGDWLCGPGEAPRRLPRPAWSYDTSARDWSSKHEWLEAWELCDDARWMLHAAARTGIDRRLVVLAACACARTSLRRVPEGEVRPLRAIETAEAWARGEATAEQVRTAANAAYAAAYAAANAAYAAAFAANADAAYAASAAYAAYAASAYAASAASAYAASAAAYAAASAAAYVSVAAHDRADRHSREWARRGALRELASLVRSRIHTLDVLRAAASSGGDR